MKRKINSWFGLIVLLSLSFLTLGNSIISNAKTINVDPDQEYQGYANDLFLDTKPEQSGVTYSTNIPSSRLKVYEKSKNVPTSEQGSYPFFGTQGTFASHDMSEQGFHKRAFPEYVRGWDSIGFDITSPTSSDYIETSHKKVGKFGNKWINAKVRYSNLKHAAVWGGGIGIHKSHGYLDISENLTNGRMYANFSMFDISYTFTYMDSGKEVEFISDADNHSFLTFNSLNARYLPSMAYPDSWVSTQDSSHPLHASEFVTYLTHDTNAETTNVYVTKDSNIQSSTVAANGSSQNFFNGKTDEGFEDKLGSQTFKKNSVSFELKGTTQTFRLGAGRACAWATDSGATLFMEKPSTIQPSKKVLSEDGKEIDTQEVKKGQTVLWEVSVPVGNMGANLLEKYSELKVVDPLPNQVDYVSYKVLDSTGKDITTDTTIAMNGQETTVNFSNDYLQNKMLYESETYKVVFTTKVKNSLTGYNKIENQASVFYNKMKLPTEKPHVWEKEKIENKVEKSVTYNGNTGKTATVDFDKEYSYTVNFQVGNEEELTNLVLSDDLADVQTVVKAVVKDDAAKDITDQGTLTIDAKTANVTWKANKPNDYQGKKLSMIITAKLNDVPELANYLESGVIKVPNTAKMITNTKETPSDKTTVTPPTVESKAEKFIVLK